MRKKINLSNVEGFEWDKGNKSKSALKHKVKNSESEEIFSNNPVFLPDGLHSQTEDRWHAFGVTNKGRFLLVAITIRENKIRVISARNQNNREKKYYEKNKKNTKV